MAVYIYTDADNTLWDTDGVYAFAQIGLLHDVGRHLAIETYIGEEGLQYVRKIDQIIASSHQSGLRYPPQLLLQALKAALTGTEIQLAARLALKTVNLPKTNAEEEKIIERFLDRLRMTPHAREGVLSGVREMKKCGLLIHIVTEGSAERVKKIATELGLSDFVSGVIEARKSTGLYKRLKLKSRGRIPIMIGDQIDRDIIYAHNAGMKTIYFPGGFSPSWNLNTDETVADWKISSFEEVPAIIAQVVKS